MIRSSLKIIGIFAVSALGLVSCSYHPAAQRALPASYYNNSTDCPNNFFPQNTMISEWNSPSASYMNTPDPYIMPYNQTPAQCDTRQTPRYSFTR